MDLSAILKHCASPIELRLARAFISAMSDADQACMEVMPLDPIDYSPMTEMPHGGVAYLIPQAVISGDDDWSYRVDFLFVCGYRRSFRRAIAIECDGHEWHEKTKEQAARDKLRDRRLLLSGIATVRFAGSEIHADADECADYVRGLVHSTTGDALHEQSIYESWREFVPAKPFSYKGGAV